MPAARTPGRFSGVEMSTEELLTLPVSVDIVTAGRALGIGRTKTFELHRAGKFPIRVLTLGKAYRCATADLLTALGHAPERPAAPGHEPEHLTPALRRH